MTELRVSGQGLEPRDAIAIGGRPVATRLDEDTLVASVTLSRGTYLVEVDRRGERFGRFDLQVSNSPPQILAPEDVVIDEHETLHLPIEVYDRDGDPLSVWAESLPPGARLHLGVLHFRPDFTQSGAYPIQIHASDPEAEVDHELRLEVRDVIHPPSPRITRRQGQREFEVLSIVQTTDGFLEPADSAGREYAAVVIAPRSGEPRSAPVHIELHGYGGGPRREGWPGEIVLRPSDPDNTYWWGKLDGGIVQPFTQRRILHLLEWVLNEWEIADPTRVYVDGGSMGGTGAATFGFLHARHVAWINAWIGQTVPRNHRPSRIEQLSAFWGSPEVARPGSSELSAWDEGDLTRAVLHQWESANQIVFSKHGRDDPLIHFGAVITPSPFTGVAFYDALQIGRVGHMVVWDEGGHGQPDPRLGPNWFRRRWQPIYDDISFVRTDLMFVAFSNSSRDDEPGSGDGNGRRPWDEESGYAGRVSVPGDTGWDGDRYGILNRGLRWDARAIVDTYNRLEVPVRCRLGPTRVDLTPRRVQRFVVSPGERVRWTLGDASGEITADAEGALTVRQAELDEGWRTLRLERALPR